MQKGMKLFMQGTSLHLCKAGCSFFLSIRRLLVRSNDVGTIKAVGGSVWPFRSHNQSVS